jgi:pSer/pThr/pTyr-binding forkhead associated (FHA) protein
MAGDWTLDPVPAAGADVLGQIVSRLVSDRVAEADAIKQAAGRPSAVVPGPRGHGFRLVSVGRDGSDGTSYSLAGNQIDIGRTEGDLRLEDRHIASRHARIVADGPTRVLVPMDRVNGVYVSLRGPVELGTGDRFLVGKQLLRFELMSAVDAGLRPAVDHGVARFGTPTIPAWAKLRQLTPAAVTRDVYHINRSEIVLGRESGDIVFSDDEFMSRRHARIALKDGRAELEDLGSSNGTFVRLRGPHTLLPGDLIRLGDEMLRFEA